VEEADDGASGSAMAVDQPISDEVNNLKVELDETKAAITAKDNEITKLKQTILERDSEIEILGNDPAQHKDRLLATIRTMRLTQARIGGEHWTTAKSLTAAQTQIAGKDAELDALKAKHTEDMNGLTMRLGAELEAEKTAHLESKAAGVKGGRAALLKAKNDEIAKLSEERRIADRAACESERQRVEAEEKYKTELKDCRDYVKILQGNCDEGKLTISQLVAYHGGPDTVKKYIDDNFTSSEEEQIGKHPLLMRIVNNSKKWYDMYLVALGSAHAAREERSSCVARIQAELDMCRHGILMTQMERLTSYGL
jgi:hypothetical protein